MKNINIKYGTILKKAEQFEKLQTELSGLIQIIKDSKVCGVAELCNKSGVPINKFYKGLQENKFTADQIVRIFRTLTELQSFHETVQQHLPNLLEISNVRNYVLLEQIQMTDKQFLHRLEKKNLTKTEIQKIFVALMELSSSNV